VLDDSGEKVWPTLPEALLVMTSDYCPFCMVQGCIWFEFEDFARRAWADPS
jgi:hypothetical protein